MRAVLLVVAGWLLAAGVASLLGVLAVHLLGTGVVAGTGTLLSADDVQRELARSPGAGAGAGPGSPGAGAGSPSPSAAPSPSSAAPGGGQSTARSDRRGDGSLQTVDTPGGTVIARCDGSRVELVSWTPRQGFDADEEVGGGQDAVYLEFSSDDLTVHVAIGCPDGSLVPLVVTGDDD